MNELLCDGGGKGWLYEKRFFDMAVVGASRKTLRISMRHIRKAFKKLKLTYIFFRRNYILFHYAFPINSLKSPKNIFDNFILILMKFS